MTSLPLRLAASFLAALIMLVVLAVIVTCMLYFFDHFGIRWTGMIFLGLCFALLWYRFFRDLKDES